MEWSLVRAERPSSNTVVEGVERPCIDAKPACGRPRGGGRRVHEPNKSPPRSPSLYFYRGKLKPSLTRSHPKDEISYTADELWLRHLPPSRPPCVRSQAQTVVRRRAQASARPKEEQLPVGEWRAFRSGARLQSRGAVCAATLGGGDAHGGRRMDYGRGVVLRCDWLC